MQKNQLVFRISDSSFTGSLLQGEILTVLFHEHFQSKSEQACKEQLQRAIEQADLTRYTIDEVSLAWFSPYASLVPVNVFAVSDPKTLFHSTFESADERHEIDFNRISELGIVNVFDIPFWIKSFFVTRFPRIVLQHETTHVLRGIFSKPTFKPAIHLSIVDDWFQLIFVKHNQLLFYNTFHFTNAADILYYLSFSAQQLAWNEPQTILHGYGLDELITSEIEQHLQRISMLSAWQLAPLSSTLKFQQTCV